MRSGIFFATASLALILESGCAGAQGVGAPPMVEPLRNADPYGGPDPSEARTVDPYAAPPAEPFGEPAPPQESPPLASAPSGPPGPPLDVDRVMDGVKKCWTTIPRVYGTEAQGGVARIRLKFQPDGRLDGPPMIMDKPQGPVGLKFAESAANAIQRCQPYSLPPERYAEWRQIEMRFDTIDPDNPPPPPAPAATMPDAMAPDGAPPAISTPDGYVPSVPGPADPNTLPQ